MGSQYLGIKHGTCTPRIRLLSGGCESLAQHSAFTSHTIGLQLQHAMLQPLHSVPSPRGSHSAKHTSLFKQSPLTPQLPFLKKQVNQRKRTHAVRSTAGDTSPPPTDSSAPTFAAALLEPIEPSLPRNPHPSLINEDFQPTMPEGRIFSIWDLTSLWIGLVVAVRRDSLCSALARFLRFCCWLIVLVKQMPHMVKAYYLTSIATCMMLNPLCIYVGCDLPQVLTCSVLRISASSLRSSYCSSSVPTLSVQVPTYYLAGSLVEMGMSWWQGVVTVFCGNMLVLLPMILNGELSLALSSLPSRKSCSLPDHPMLPGIASYVEPIRLGSKVLVSYDIFDDLESKQGRLWSI